MHRVTCCSVLRPARLLAVQPILSWRRTVIVPHQRCQAAASSSVAAAGQHEVVSTHRPRNARDADRWPGLSVWRAAEVDERIAWGDKTAVKATRGSAQSEVLGDSLASCAQQVLSTADPGRKAHITHLAWQAYQRGQLPVGAATPPPHPSRPVKPKLVPPRQIPSMKVSPLPTNVYMLHNLAHIELNAIDLAWDTVARFSQLGLPEEFYADFARVADDEARHLSWCLQRLEELGYDYGCMPAHNLLWEGAEMSAGDLFARLAIVPMSQEARGLDAGKRLAEKLVGWGDNRTAAIVHRIAVEERNHVAVGVTWFQAICEALGVDPGPSFRSLLMDLCPDLLKGPFNHEERDVVGLPRSWYDTTTWAQEQQQVVALGQKQRPQHSQQEPSLQAAGVGASMGAGPPVRGADPSASTTAGTPSPPLSSSKEDWTGAHRLLAVSPDLGHVSPGQLMELKERLAAVLEVESRASA